MKRVASEQAQVGDRAGGQIVVREQRRRDAGMTMLEIMIVLALIGLVMSAVGVGVFAQFKKGQRKVAQAQVNDIAAKIVQYMADNSECPKSLDDLVAQKYLPKRQKDPWNREIIIRCPGTVNTESVDVVSLGPDGQEGTADDVKAAEQ
ncbi:MAG: type II secretion system protein GspG [Polyangia bacterium]|jgi:general secretion pathway protein G